MKKNKIIVKVFSVFLTVLIIANILPMQVFAEEVTALNEENTVIGDTTESEAGSVQTEAGILTEEISKREEYVKHFRMSDGTYQAVQYETPVHFEKNNEWVEYDNTLEETEASDEENEGKIIKNKDYINKLADFSVRFSKKTNGHKFVRYEKDGYELSWYYEDAKKKSADVIKIEADDDETTLEKNSSNVVYKGVFKDTDLQYIVNTQGVKENIVLNSVNAPTEYVAQYKVNGLKPVQIDDKTIELQNEKGEVIYIISAPYMIDGNGVVSQSLSIELSDVKNNKFTVTLTLDSSWLQEEDRAYPVIADPAIVTSQYWGESTTCTSAFVSSRHGNKCYGKGTSGYEGSLYVGYETVVSDLDDENGLSRQMVRGYFQCPTLPQLSVADKVVDAKVNFCCQLSSVNTILLYGVTEAWQSNNITWNNQPAWEDNITDYNQISSKIPNLKYPWNNPSSWLSWEITELVQKWYANPSTNHGFVLKAAQEEVGYKTWLYSSDYNYREDARPFITITYRNMSGYEDYYSYTSLSAGRGGTASVNNYNGNLVFTQPLTLDTGCNNMPVNLSLVYNNNGDANPYGFMGNRVQTNFHIYLRYDSALAGNGYRYYLNDADGTKHWFYFENADATTGKDEDGLGYTLDVIDVGSDTACSNARFRITDKSKNKMYFDEGGTLYKIENSNNVAITLEYETYEGAFRLKSITDGAGRKYTIGYHETYHYSICNFTDPVGRVTHIYTDGNNNLSGVEFPDGKYICLCYGSNGMLTEIYDIDGNKTAVTYYNNVQKQVMEFAWGNNQQAVDYYSFVYKQNATDITDKQGRKFTYQFNDWGQNTSVVSKSNNTAQFFEYYTPDENDKAGSSRNKVLATSKALTPVNNYLVNPGFVRSLTDGYWTWHENEAYQTSFTVVDDIGYLTNKALKISKESWNTSTSLSVQTVTGLKSGWYTVSGYVNTFGQTLGGDGIFFGYEVWDSTDSVNITRVNCEYVSKTDTWERLDIPLYIEEGQVLRVVFGYNGNSYGTFYLDDLQLEDGKGACSYNLLENPAINNGGTKWSNEASIVNVSNLAGFTKAIKKNTDPTKQWLGLNQFIYTTNGKAGDVYSLGAWVKAASAPTNGNKTNAPFTPQFSLALHFYRSANDGNPESVKINANDDYKDWQFVTGKAIAPVDYHHICFEVIYYSNVNSVSMTGAFCYREQFGQSYTYDNEGNVISAKDLANANSSFAYQGNNLVNAINPSGSAFLYRYGDTNNNLYCADSTNGVRYSFGYDSYGNATSATVSEMKFATYLEYNVTYNIRNKHSGNTFDSGGLNETVHNYGYSYDYNNAYQEWTLEYAGEDGVYYLKSNNRYLYVDGGSSADGAYFKTAETNTGEDKFKFKIEGNGNGTWSIKSKTSGYWKCVDGMPGDTNDCSNATPITQQTYVYGNAGQEWYFYIKSSGNGKKVITTAAEYIANGNYLYKQSDQNGNVTRYNYDQYAGRLYSVTDAKGNTTKYTYNNDTNQLASVSSGGMTNYYHYENDKLTYINSNNSVGYKFTYDNFGRILKNEVGNGTDHKTLSTMTYDNTKNLLLSQAYGNGDRIDYSYDNLDRLEEIKYNNDENKKKTYVYGSDGNISNIQDTSSNTRTKYVYDLSGRLVETKEYSGTNLTSNLLLSNVEYIYQDKTNYLTWMNHSSDLGDLAVAFGYGNIANGEMPDQVYNVWWNGTTHMSRSFDGLGRLSSSVINSNELLRTNYHYKDVSATQTTTQLDYMETPAGTLAYTYDSVGNITSIYNGVNLITYEYDSLNQLVRENDQRTGKTYTYTYLNGNITSKTEYAYTTGALGAVQNVSIYGYGDSVWKDLLTSYKGNAINYDEIGNMTRFGGRTFDWTGRQLNNFVDSNSYGIYYYNMDGQRIYKEANGVTTNYYYNGDILAGQISSDGTKLIFLYDENGDIFGLNYAGDNYYYIKNAQNDVIAIANTWGNILCYYEYDAWGKVISITGDVAWFGQLNPIRYRSYYYDNESGYYYLQSRYYNPEIGRFINADSLIDNRGIITQNLFQYCGNNPVNNADPSGNLFGAIVGIGLLVIGMVATLSGCSSKPAASPSKPSTPSKPSNPSSSSSSTTSPHIPTPQEKSYAATVYAEAGGQNKRSKQAVAHVMNNRIGTRSSWTDIESVISAKYQFDGYNSPMYQAAMNYYNNGICNNSIEQAAMDECLAVVIPIYSGAESDITGGALYFHSFANPSDWAYHNSYTQVYVSGTEKFWFYK